MFPLKWPAVTGSVLAGVAGVVLAQAFCRRDHMELWARSGPLRFPLAVFACCVGVGAYVSPFQDLMVPKLCGLLLGALIFRAVLLTGVTMARLRLLTLAYVAAGTAIVLSGVFVAPSWPDKVKPLRALALKIPALVPGLPGAEAGVNANALGGSTLFFLPLLSAIAVARVLQSRPAARHSSFAWSALAGAVYGGGAAVLVTVLLLSQSRTAWVSAVATLGLVLALQVRTTRWIRLGATAVFLGMAVALTLWLWPAPAEYPSRLNYVGGRTFTWSLAIDAIRQSPVAGVGLGAFRTVAESMQAGSGSSVVEVANAHNTFLQVALDVGLPGLVAYLALLVLATKMTFDLRRHHTRDDQSTLCVGLWASLVAVHLFGMVDAIAPGAKVGVFMWWNLGLIAALHAVSRDSIESPRA